MLRNYHQQGSFSQGERMTVGGASGWAGDRYFLIEAILHHVHSLPFVSPFLE